MIFFFTKEHIQYDSGKVVKVKITQKFTLKQKCRIYLEKKGEIRAITIIRTMYVQIRIFRKSQILPFIVFEILMKRQEIPINGHLKTLQVLELDKFF